MIVTNKLYHELMAAPKKFTDSKIQLPTIGESKHYEIVCINRHEKLFIDTNRSGKIELRKATLQNRYRVPLVRIDLDSPPHTNPDGTKTTRNHLHIFQEGYGDSWAYDLETFAEYTFNASMEFTDIFLDLCNFCNIELPEVQNTL